MFVFLIMFLFLNSIHFIVFAIPQTKRQNWAINIKYRYVLQATVLESKPEQRKNVSNVMPIFSLSHETRNYFTRSSESNLKNS